MDLVPLATDHDQIGNLKEIELWIDTDYLQANYVVGATARQHWIK